MRGVRRTQISTVTSLIITKTKLTGVSVAELERFAVRARRSTKLRGEVAVLITTNEEIRELNRSFRRKDKPTDVLSFPSDARGMAGDIAISAEIAAENGEAMGHGLATELKILILHGMLHLGGYDHESDTGEMAEFEAKLREKLELPHGLIERASGGRTAAGSLPRRAAGRLVAAKVVKKSRTATARGRA